MVEIIKTLLVSLAMAATGAGIAWSVTSDAQVTLTSLVVESGSNQDAKGDRLDIPSTKSDRLPTATSSHPQDVVIVYGRGDAASMIFHAPS